MTTASVSPLLGHLLKTGACGAWLLSIGFCVLHANVDASAIDSSANQAFGMALLRFPSLSEFIHCEKCTPLQMRGSG